MYFSHLECASGCGAGPFDPRQRHFLCPSCALPLFARYDRMIDQADGSIIAQLPQRLGGVQRGLQPWRIQRFDQGQNGAGIAQFTQHERCAPTHDEIFITILNCHDKGIDSEITPR